MLAQHLLAGHGPVFNVGERVEVYSNPLWLVLLTGSTARPVRLHRVAALDLGLVGTAIGFVLAGRAVQRLGTARTTAWSSRSGSWSPRWSPGSGSSPPRASRWAWLRLAGSLLLVARQDRGGPAVRRGVRFVSGSGHWSVPSWSPCGLVDLVALGLVVAAPGWSGPTGRWRRYGAPLVAALALPVVYELWRTAYFALVVSNTTLAKGRGSGWGQGLTFLWDLVSPRTRCGCRSCWSSPRGHRGFGAWWRAGDRTGVVLLVAPVVAGLADAVVVVHVGGDYMGDRLAAAGPRLRLPPALPRTSPSSGPPWWPRRWASPSGPWSAGGGSGPTPPPASWSTTASGTNATSGSGDRDRHPIMAADFQNTSAVAYRSSPPGAAQGRRLSSSPTRTSW